MLLFIVSHNASSLATLSFRSSSSDQIGESSYLLQLNVSVHNMMSSNLMIFMSEDSFETRPQIYIILLKLL